MKFYFSILIVFGSFFSDISNPITATIVFENNTEKTSISGVFYITETNQSFEVNSLDDFTIELPKKGKYHFGFYSEDVNAFTYYPVRITNKKNTITIKLKNKPDLALKPSVKYFALKNISDFTTEQLEDGMAAGTINFIVHGLIAPEDDKVQLFKEKYGVGFISENCVVDPMSFKIAMKVNKKIEVYLTDKFGEDWRKGLPATPFGLQLSGF